MLKKLVFAAVLALTVATSVSLADYPIPPCNDPACSPAMLVR